MRRNVVSEDISIHSPHTRGDVAFSIAGIRFVLISIHSPHTRGDSFEQPKVTPSTLFQSTPLIRGETMELHSCSKAYVFQSTPLIRGETEDCMIVMALRVISIHSPHTRGDVGRYRAFFRAINFNPLPSYEGRPCTPSFRRKRRHFNPLPSYEGRPVFIVPDAHVTRFQSTPLIRGETLHSSRWCCHEPISIHSPHTRGDVCQSYSLSKTTYFNPLPSYEGRRFQAPRNRPQFPFQSTPLIRGETVADTRTKRVWIISIHSPHTRGDPLRAVAVPFVFKFQSTPLIRGET